MLHCGGGHSAERDVAVVAANAVCQGESIKGQGSGINTLPGEVSHAEDARRGFADVPGQHHHEKQDSAHDSAGLSAAKARIEAGALNDDVLHGYQARSASLFSARADHVKTKSVKTKSIDDPPGELSEPCSSGLLIETIAAAAAGAAADAEGSPVAVDRMTRRQAVTLLCQLGDRLQMPPSDQMQMVGLLDLLCLRTVGEDQVSWLPGACATICDIVRTANQAGSFGCWSEHAQELRRTGKIEMQKAQSWFIDLLRENHELDEEIVSKPFHMQEKWVLQKLTWQINVPTVEDWLSAFCGRLDTGTLGIYRPSLAWAYNMSVSKTKLFVHHLTVVELQQQRFARGLVCSALIAASLVPYHMLYPEVSYDASEWNWLFGDNMKKHATGVPKTSLRPQAEQNLGEILQLALNANLEELRGDCMFFTERLREVRALTKG